MRRVAAVAAQGCGVVLLVTPLPFPFCFVLSVCLLGAPFKAWLPAGSFARDSVSTRCEEEKKATLLSTLRYTAGMMSDGFSRVTGRMSMMIAQNGPGVANFVTPVKTAHFACAVRATWRRPYNLQNYSPTS